MICQRPDVFTISRKRDAGCETRVGPWECMDEGGGGRREIPVDRGESEGKMRGCVYADAVDLVCSVLVATMLEGVC